MTLIEFPPFVIKKFASSFWKYLDVLLNAEQDVKTAGYESFYYFKILWRI